MRTVTAGPLPPPRVPPDHLADHASRKLVRIILSYTGCVNRRVWYR